jgi:hypothetical protein
MRVFFLAALTLLLAGCGAYTFPGASTSPTGVVTGRVLAYPCAPVEQAGATCAGRPAQGLELDYIENNTTAGKAVTDAQGEYSVQLAPGTYVVKLKTYMRVMSGPTNLTVSAGSTVTADYLLDSGIRAPVPQA